MSILNAEDSNDGQNQLLTDSEEEDDEFVESPPIPPKKKHTENYFAFVKGYEGLFDL